MALRQATAERNRNAKRLIYIASNGGQSLRQGGWKSIVRKQSKPELYNIAADPYETTDLATAEPSRVDELQALLQAERAKDQKDLPADLVGLPK